MIKTSLVILTLIITNCLSPTKCFEKVENHQHECHNHATDSLAIDYSLEEECIETGDPFLATLTCESIDNLQVKNTSSSLIDVDIVYENEEFSISFENTGYPGEYTITLESENNNVYSDVISFYIYSDGENDCGSFNCIEDARRLYYSVFLATEEELILVGLQERPSSFSSSTDTYTALQEMLDFVFGTGGATICTNRYPNQNNNGKVLVEGIIQWRDEYNVLHPLENNAIAFLDKDAVIDDYCGMTSTDESGYFSLYISEQTILELSGIDIYVFLPAITGAASVYLGTIPYCYISDIAYNVGSNTTLYYSITIDPQSKLRAAAFEIPQAMNIGYKYVYEMNETMIPNVPVLYPVPNDSTSFGASSFFDTTYGIIIGYDYYKWWDVLIHEYGHHIEHQYNLADMSIHKRHYVGDDLCKLHGRLNGLKFAFCEGLATYLSIASQLYYQNDYDIPHAFDYQYNDPDFYEDYNDFYSNGGEGFERTIPSALLKIMDDVTRTNDNVSLGHQEIWMSIVNNYSGHWCMAELIETIISRNPSMTSNICLILEKENLAYHVLSSNITMNTSSTSTCWTFSWELYNNQHYLHPDTFNLVFVGDNFWCFAIEGITSTSYTLTDQEKNILLNLPGNTINWYIECLTTHFPNYPIYKSKIRQFAKPTSDLLLNTGSSNFYTRNGIHWYKFIALETSIYTFKSTGSANASGELFNSIKLNNDSSGCLASDNLGGGGNFTFNYILQQNQVVFLRVKNNSNLTDNITTIVQNNHIHSYTFSYNQWDEYYHKSYCECGLMIYENHVSDNGMGVMGIGLENRCIKCGYYFTSPIQ